MSREKKPDAVVTQTAKYERTNQRSVTSLDRGGTDSLSDLSHNDTERD